MQKVAIYCRLSDEDRNKINKCDDSESIQNQKNMLMKHAMDKGWDIYKIYSDDDYSGLDKDRPEFKQMIQEAEAGKFNIILCKHQSRFSRDIEITERYLHNRFIQWGIRFVSVTDHVDTTEKANKKSRQINSLVNEWYSEDISEAIKATFKIKREQGKFIGSFASYGYIKDPTDKNKIIIDEEAARVVRMIFNWYLQGHGTHHIAVLLNERGIPNPTKYKQSKGLKYDNPSQTDSYGLWNKTTIRRILRNEIYIGNMVQARTSKVSYKSSKVVTNNKDKWIIVEDTHESIIDLKTFEAVQRRISIKPRGTGAGTTHIFATKVNCMECGSSLNKVRNSQGTEYLRCKLYARDPRKKLCTSHSIRLSQLVSIVTERIHNHIKQINEGSLISRLEQQDTLSKAESNLKQELQIIQRQIEEKNSIIKNLYADKVKGAISEQQYHDLNCSFQNERITLENRKRLIEEELKKISDKTEMIDKWRKVVRQFLGFEELTHGMVNELIRFVEVGEKDKEEGEQLVKIHWNF